MAADDAMPAAGPALRFYFWSEPTLSLGYFQPAADREAVESLKPLPLVRRSTGGAAIVHGDGDLTYSISIPADRQYHGGESWVCRMHQAIQTALSAYGVRAEGVVCGNEKKLGPVLCFRHQTPADVLVGSHKVVGSAQRKSRGSILQHGTILLKKSRFAPELPGIEDLTGKRIPAGELAANTAAELVRATGWRAEIAPEVVPDAAAVAKYRSAAWTNKR